MALGAAKIHGRYEYIVQAASEGQKNAGGVLRIRCVLENVLQCLSSVSAQRKHINPVNAKMVREPQTISTLFAMEVFSFETMQVPHGFLSHHCSEVISPMHV